MMIFVGASSSDIQGALNNLNPGDVLEIQNGTYNVDGLQLHRSGTSNNPIYIRGESQDGVVLSDPTGRILQILDASNVIIENMTFQGSGIDSGTSASSQGVSFWDGAPIQTTIPAILSRLGSAVMKAMSFSTANGGAKVPTKFFTPYRFTPFFTPTPEAQRNLPINEGRDIPRAVVGLIAGISLLDALLVVGTGAIEIALLCVFGFAVTLMLQRYVPGT